MCGIAGIIGIAAPVDPGDLRAMNEAQKHRGPDGEGVWSEGALGLGHRRLSIIDPQGGAQPMTSEDGAFRITYNGELYNYRELRDELVRCGRRFRTQSDTEVLLQSYAEWGENCVTKFRGMFAFGIVDMREKTLFLARDHYGIKPLVYAKTDGWFAFSSELSALKRLPGFPRTIDLDAIDEYLWFQYIPAPRTGYRNAKKLPPGHTLTIGFDGQAGQPQRYARESFQSDHFRSAGEWIEALRAAIDETVAAHLVSDVPFGAFLSGGIDSGTVVAAMSGLLDAPVHTFTIGFRQQEYDESAAAALVAQSCGADARCAIVEPDALGILPELVLHYGEPFGDSSAIPTYYVSKLARQFVPMVLSGDGGDEAFAGYNTYKGWMELPEEQRTMQQWCSIVQYLSGDMRRRLWKEEYRPYVSEESAVFHQAFAESITLSPVHRVQYCDSRTYLPFDILTKVDIASMANGLEVRTPFVDSRFRDLITKVPDRWMFGENAAGVLEGKLLLRRLQKNVLPAEILSRPKQGFAVPLSHWFKKGGSLRSAVEERLLSPGSVLHTCFEPAVIRELVEQERSGPVWLLLFLEEWLRQQQGPVRPFA
ncbi:asparagine synthase (glutamine-hydrolyzing) [Candidatus Peribacteria bacterium RIFCSPHIGHO2_02_FULL_49_16]|nr:MAG: asparagine synthase (glutamine-hydrolyzing) [Candidatus Peribacteria bacterium RIFCSPHIGHO2_01_FULL_49_38]OGJ59683.1 MAG: asparagine synthase (glutamine-hydrolyzing) [Candidatus Peribacteria bacterium RIFCSPHIGHO2_02_FULL_49_16]